MAILQFSTCGRESTAVPVSIHCDHLISAFEGAEADLKVRLFFFCILLCPPSTAADPLSRLQRSMISEKEVFDFLQSASRKYGIEFWGPGSGIIHQIVLESAFFPCAHYFLPC
jgi:aconitase A